MIAFALLLTSMQPSPAEADPVAAAEAAYANGDYDDAAEKFGALYEQTDDPVNQYRQAQALRLGGRDAEAADGSASGVDHAEAVGFDTIVAKGVDLARGLPEGGFVAGFSLGALPAQAIAHTKPGVAGLVLLHGGDVPVGTFGEVWPSSVAVQIHLAEGDTWCALDEAREFAGATDADLHVCSGEAHLFTDSSFHEYDEAATASVLERMLAFLDR